MVYAPLWMRERVLQRGKKYTEIVNCVKGKYALYIKNAHV